MDQMGHTTCYQGHDVNVTGYYWSNQVHWGIVAQKLRKSHSRFHLRLQGVVVDVVIGPSLLLGVL